LTHYHLEGEAVDRDVIVFLPPSYHKNKKSRYPVVYALHGFSIGAEQWTHEIHVPQTIEGAFAQGAKEMIIVPARFEDGLRRLHVFELPYHG
jgi:enterochelin esterase-like enzyme